MLPSATVCHVALRSAFCRTHGLSGFGLPAAHPNEGEWPRLFATGLLQMHRGSVHIAHPSSFVGVGIWLACLVGLMMLRPGVDSDLAHRGVRAWILAGSFCLFLLSVLVLQWQLGLPTAALHFGSPRSLTVHGAFRITRNPIYCLFLLPIGGLAAYSAPAAALAAVAYIVAMSRLVIGPEEQALLARFGYEYAAYSARTPRWLLVARPVIMAAGDNARGSDEVVWGAVLGSTFLVFWLVWHLGYLHHLFLTPA
jgi:protein-S-isoprenylcysteine O-methyltransferase Ste14